MSKDYYKILGIDKNASPEEIKRAFWKLAQKHHPDKGGDHENFKEINEAYQVLGNPQKRAQYDKFGSNFEQAQAQGGYSGFGGFRDYADFAETMGANGGFENMEFDLGDIFGDVFGFGGGSRSRRRERSGGRNITVEMPINFRDAVFGGEKIIELDKNVVCPHCHGSGNEPGSKFSTCPTCKGSGQIVETQRTIFGQIKTAATCPTCLGAGKKAEKSCSQCKGEGRVKNIKKLKIKIPAGINNGQSIKISGEGEAGAKGMRSGNLIITFFVKEDPHFIRHGDDILTKEYIEFSQAVLGDKMKAQTLDGEVLLKIPAGTQSGKIFRLGGRGVHHLRGFGRGDQLTEIIIKTPESLTKKQKELLEELKNEGL